MKTNLLRIFAFLTLTIGFSACDEDETGYGGPFPEQFSSWKLNLEKPLFIETDPLTESAWEQAGIDVSIRRLLTENIVDITLVMSSHGLFDLQWTKHGEETVGLSDFADQLKFYPIPSPIDDDTLVIYTPENTIEGILKSLTEKNPALAGLAGLESLFGHFGFSNVYGIPFRLKGLDQAKVCYFEKERVLTLFQLAMQFIPMENVELAANFEQLLPTLSDAKFLNIGFFFSQGPSWWGEPYEP
jgi:hypothetical protein